jgi:hypothetical protein
MTKTSSFDRQPAPHRGDHRIAAALALGLGFSLAFGCLVFGAAPALAQGWWPWSNSEPERPPIPDEPVYGGPPPAEQITPNPQTGGAPGQPGAAAPTAPSANWSTKNPICLQLEQRLVQDSQRTSQSRNELPRIESDIRLAEQASDQAEQELQRRQCFEYFLFAKSLRRTRTCVDLAHQKDIAQRQISDLEAQRQQILGSSERSYRDDIVRELARNNCGANYVQEARRQDHGPFSSIWQDEEGGGGGGNSWAPYAGAPVELYYYQNPGATVDQSIALRTNEPYTSLKTAFRYRKELVKGCSCKEAEFVPDDEQPNGKRAEGKADGWEARSEWEARTARETKSR